MSNLGNKKIFSDNLKYYMDFFKKDRIKICKDLNIKYTTFTDWVNGNVYPRIDKIEMIANYLNIQKSDLIEERVPDIEKEDKELISLLKKRGFMKNDSDLTAEELKRLIEFANANKKFILLDEPRE